MDAFQIWCALGAIGGAILLYRDARRRSTRLSLSIRGIAAGVLLLFAAYFGLRTLYGPIAPMPAWELWLFAGPWHCGLILTLAIVAAGYVAGRVAGRDREMNGLLAGLCFTLYVAAMKSLDDHFQIAGDNTVESLQPFLDAPLFGMWGGVLSRIKPLARLRSLAAAVAERRRQKRAQARAGYKLVLLNDDRTPMEFVLDLLQRFFAMDRRAALAAMLHIHHHGRGIAAVYDDDEAAGSKLAELAKFIAGAGQPLRCVVEP